MNPIYKANDVRGIYPSELNESVISGIGRAMADHFGDGAKVVLGHDARLSSPSLYMALKTGILESKKNIDLMEAGLMTTPMLYFLVAENKADGGIMVTASHNPKEYNGLKIVGKEARPISGKEVGGLVSGSIK